MERPRKGRLPERSKRGRPARRGHSALWRQPKRSGGGAAAGASTKGLSLTDGMGGTGMPVPPNVAHMFLHQRLKPSSTAFPSSPIRMAE